MEIERKWMVTGWPEGLPLEEEFTMPENGTLVDVVSPKGAYLGTGFLSLKSKIRVRLISRNAERLDRGKTALRTTSQPRFAQQLPW